MPKRTQLSEAEREQRRAADRAFVQQAVEQLRSSDGWQRLAHHAPALPHLLPRYLRRRASPTTSGAAFVSTTCRASSGAPCCQGSAVRRTAS